MTPVYTRFEAAISNIALMLLLGLIVWLAFSLLTWKGKEDE